MQFLKKKFNDNAGIIEQFLTEGNLLNRLEGEDVVSNHVKRAFVNSFLDKLEADQVITPEIRALATDGNPWSIDFPSWHGSFDIEKGKRYFVIGSEPHIHYPYLQSVYQMNGQNATHRIFDVLTALLSFHSSSKEAILDELYLTDLFPLAPMRGNRKHVGTKENLQKFLGDVGLWEELRYRYASVNLTQEIEFVKPSLIIVQGIDVMVEVLKILRVAGELRAFRIDSKPKPHFVRLAQWNGYKIVSVPHVGTKRHKGFYSEHTGDVGRLLSELVSKLTPVG